MAELRATDTQQLVAKERDLGHADERECSVDASRCVGGTKGHSLALELVTVIDRDPGGALLL